MADKRDYYDILGIARDADDRDIKKAYRKLALQNHPDRNPGDAEAEERFKEAAEAYAVLSDAEKRATYDRFGHAGLGGGPGADAGDIFSAFSDIFSDFFGFNAGGGPGGRRDPNAPQRGQDLQLQLGVPFTFAVHGGEKTVTIPVHDTCDTCDGSGAAPGTSPVSCATCGGAGQVRHSQGLFTIQTACPRCRGRGKVIETPCSSCHGRGRVERQKEVNVKVPAGVDTGNRLRVRAEGEPGANGGPPGDLYIRLVVESSDLFERDGRDLHLPLPIDFPTAALGGEVEIPTLDGTEKVAIKAGTQHGDVRRLRGEGLPAPNGGGRGDLYIHFRLEVPTKLSASQKELIAELAEVSGSSTAGQKHGFFDRIREIFERPRHDA